MHKVGETYFFMSDDHYLLKPLVDKGRSKRLSDDLADKRRCMRRGYNLHMHLIVDKETNAYISKISLRYQMYLHHIAHALTCTCVSPHKEVRHGI